MRNVSRTGEGKECANPRVLIVEDEMLVAIQLEDMLAEEGFDVIGTVPDRASLANVVRKPDVALVDLNLRDGFTGPTIAKNLADRFGSRIVYVTANPERIGENAPAPASVVQKPFSREAILDSLNIALAADEAHKKRSRP